MIRCLLKHIIIVSSIMFFAAQSSEEYDDEKDSYDISDCSDDICNDSSAATSPVCEPPCSGGPNDVCKLCTTHCPGTCQRKYMPCLESCGPKGCECKMGYVRGPKNQCILPNECPPTDDDSTDEK